MTRLRPRTCTIGKFMVKDSTPILAPDYSITAGIDDVKEANPLFLFEFTLCV
jgi:hypothetical protein